MNAYFAPVRLRLGEIGEVLAGTCLALTGLLLLAAAREYHPTGTSEGSVLWGFPMLATLPLSGWASDTDTLWTLTVYGLCAVTSAVSFVGVVAGAAYGAIRWRAVPSVRRRELTDRG